MQQFVRKNFKRAAIQNLKKHYLMMFIICFVVAALGVDFSGSFDILSLKDIASGQTSQESESIGSGAAIGQISGNSDIIDLIGEILEGNLDQAEFDAKVREAFDILNASESMGRTNGIFASIANNFSSGKLYVSIARAIQNLTNSTTATAIIYALGAILIFFFFQIVFLGVVPTVMARSFLEMRTYKKVPLTRTVFLAQLHKWFHVAWVLFVMSVYELLWSLTIIGGIIKSYSYSQVPYILAENPDMKANEAITLSRQMMDGYKWKTFVLDLSLLGWYILGILTLGLTNLFFLNMYDTSIRAELYVFLRDNAKAANNALSANLNDRWLYEHPETRVIEENYSDVIEELKKPVTTIELTGIRGFFAKWFGFVLRYDEKERAYERDLARMNSLAARKDEIDGVSYPWRLNPYLPARAENSLSKRLKFGFTIYYMRNYSLTSLILIFIFFSMFGWGWEVILHYMQTGHWVNRGVLHGPWLPIYGSGGILMILFLKRLRSKPILHFFGTIVLCGIVEYWTGYACEVLLGRRYWSYDGYFLNLHGRICAEGLLAFGIGGILMVYFMAPMVDDLIRLLPMKITVPVCVVVFGLFLGDSIYSGKNPNTNTGEDDQPEPISGEVNGSAEESSGTASALSGAAAIAGIQTADFEEFLKTAVG